MNANNLLNFTAVCNLKKKWRRDIREEKTLNTLTDAFMTSKILYKY